MATFAGVTYANGSVPGTLLAPLAGQPHATLRLDAAVAWNRARADVLAQTGITLTVRGWNRTLTEQERFFYERYRVQWVGNGAYNDVRWYQGRRYVRFAGSAAAIPGTSNHGWGLAVDVEDFGGVGNFNYPRRVATMPILALHGWTETEGRGAIQEPWHLVYDPSKDTRPQIEEDDMPDLNEIHDMVVGILRAPEFELGVADRRRQTAEAVLGGMVTDDRTYGTQSFALVLGDIFAHARAAAQTDSVDVEALATALALRLPKTDAQALLDALAARLED